MIEALIAATCIALLSLTGVFFFGRNKLGAHDHVVPIAIGVFLGIVFFELIPETLDTAPEGGATAIAGGFLVFYLISHLLHTYHHHHDREGVDECGEDRKSASLVLIGDAVHNLSDGVVIATAFLVNPAIGIATTIGIALHEIPQEIAEFGILLKAGYTKREAALYNLLSASSVIAGVLVTLLFVDTFEGYLWILTGVAAGNLLFIAASDLLPELEIKHRASGAFVRSFGMTLLGLVTIVSLLTWTHERFDDGHGEDDHTDTVEMHLEGDGL